MSETAFKAMPIFGDKDYQQKACKALPILIRQARSRKPIFYEHLADELGIKNARTLNWPLGSIGATIDALASERRWTFPPPPHLQSLVINQRDKMPGSGFEAFLASRVPNYGELTKPQKREYLDGYWNDIFAYAFWDDVLDALNLPRATSGAQSILDRAKSGRGAGGGEGAEHAALKERIRQNPNMVGLARTTTPGLSEAPLPSGDKIDVLFTLRDRLYAVEVKSRISNDADITRGLFQCVKYKAVMEAERGFLSRNYRVDAILALGRPFPSALEALRNSLGVTVIVIE